MRVASLAALAAAACLGAAALAGGSPGQFDDLVGTWKGRLKGGTLTLTIQVNGKCTWSTLDGQKGAAGIEPAQITKDRIGYLVTLPPVQPGPLRLTVSFDHTQIQLGGGRSRVLLIKQKKSE